MRRVLLRGMSEFTWSITSALIVLATAGVYFVQANNAHAQTSTNEVHRLPEVVVSPVRSPVELGTQSIFTGLPPRDLMERPLTESPGLDSSISVIGTNEIRWLDAITVLDAMEYVPGAWTETRGRKEKQLFSVRGQRYPYPDYLVDGAWFREFTEAAYHFNAANVQQVEILRSSAALLLSPESLAGQINFAPREYATAETQLDTLLGSRLTTRTHLNHGAGGENIGYTLGAGYYHTDGPDQRNAEENIADFYARIRGRPAPKISLSLSTFALYGNRELELALPPASKTLQTREETFDPVRSFAVVGKARFMPADWAVTEMIANFGHREAEFHQTSSPDQMERDYEYGLRLTEGLKLGESNVLRVSGLFNHWQSPTGKRFYLGNPADLWTYSLVIVDEHRFGKLLLNGGYRLSQTYYDEFGGFAVEGSSAGLTAVKISDEWEEPLHTVSVGASYALTDEWSLEGNATWGHIAPPLGAIDENLQRPGIETRTKCDLGVRRAWPGFGQVSLTGFWVYQDNTTVRTNAGVSVDGVEYALSQTANRRSYGLELDVRTRRFDNGLQLFFNAVGMQTDVQAQGMWARDREVPEIILGGGLSYLFHQLELSVLAKHVSRYENERFLPPGSAPNDLADFVDLSVKAAYYFGKDNRSKVFVGADNVLDEKYSTVNGYPNYGVFFKGGVSLIF